MSAADVDSTQLVAGRRERKKAQTRERLIAAALELCDQNGFEATTVEQIADAVDISPRTFNRYFATKEDVVLAPIEDMIAAMGQSLAAQPRTGNEIAALVNASRQIMCGERCAESIDLARFETMNRVIQSSPSVNARSLEASDRKLASITALVAERMDLPTDDQQVKIIVAVFMALMHVALDDWGCAAGSDAGASRMAERLGQTYSLFCEVAENR